MAATPSLDFMVSEQDRRITQVVERERARLSNFIRRRVADQSDAEDILQEVFYELVEANRRMMPIEQVGAWLFRVARNRIIDLFRKKELVGIADPIVTRDGEQLLEDMLPSPGAGPEDSYEQALLLEELEFALNELPDEQREVFVANEMEGRSFKELAEETGISINTLLSRKRYAVLHLRERLRDLYEELKKA